MPHSIRTSSSRMGERLQTSYIVWRMEYLDTRSQELFAQYHTIAAKLKSKYIIMSIVRRIGYMSSYALSMLTAPLATLFQTLHEETKRKRGQ